MTFQAGIFYSCTLINYLQKYWLREATHYLFLEVVSIYYWEFHSNSHTSKNLSKNYLSIFANSMQKLRET